MKKKINVQGLSIAIESINNSDYISLTDIAASSDQRPSDLIANWLRNGSTLLFLDTWERLHNPNFKGDQMDAFRLNATNNRYTVRPQAYIKQTGAIGVLSKSGRYGGTFAHQDIALNFCYWLSPEFQVYLVKEFQRLKQAESDLLGLSWDLRRDLSKIYYSLQVDAVQSNLITPTLSGKSRGIVFASEADLLNTVVFGRTAKEWRLANPEKKGNIRDNASALELVLLAAIQVLNSKLIAWDTDQAQRLDILSETIAEWRPLLAKSNIIKNLK